MKWQSLSDVYANSVKKSALNEATINIKFNDTKEDHTFELEDVYARKVLGFTAFTAELLDQLIENWVKSGGWSDIAVQRSSDQIKLALMNVYDMSSPEIIRSIAKEIKTVIEYKENTTAFADFLRGSGNDLFELFTIEGVEMLSNPQFLSQICQIDFAENKVSVGPGEVALTLFTEAKNPKKGDLFIGSIGEIELKGALGRVGKGETERRVYNDVINKATDASGIEKIQSKYFNELQNIKANIPRLDQLLQFSSIKPNSRILRILSEVYRAKTLKDFLKHTNSGEFSKNESEKNINLIQGLVPKDPELDLDYLKNAMIQVINFAYLIHANKVGKETTQFRVYFNLDIPNEEKIGTILRYIDPRNINDNVKDLIARVYDTIPPEKIIGAITVANYQEKEDFSYIIFADTRPEVITSGSIPCKAVGPFAKKYEDNLHVVLSSVDDVTFIPNADRGGFQTMYKPSGTVSMSPEAIPSEVTPEVEAEDLNITV